MKRILALLTAFLPLVAVSRYRDGVWWEKPAFQVKPLDVGPFMIYETPFKKARFFLTRGGILVFKDWQLTLYDPSFHKKASMGNIDAIKGKVCQGLCELQLIVPGEDGRKAVLGFANKDKGVYHLVLADLSSEKWRKIKRLEKWLYPGVAPIERVKNAGVLQDFLWTAYHGHGFKPSYWIGNKLYLWFSPEYGLSFGGLHILDLKTGKIESPFKNLDIIIGLNGKYMVYSLLADKDATEVPATIRVKTDGETFALKDADPHNALFSSHWLLYRRPDHKTWVLYDLSSRREAGSFRLENGNNRGLFLTPSGRRVFLEAEIKGKKSLYLYDFREGKLYDLFPQGGEGFRVQACYDGEFFLFSHKDGLWAGYLTDLTPPAIRVKISPLYKGRAFKSPVDLKIGVKDRCFVSGPLPEITFNGKKYPLKRWTLSLKFELREGENLLEIVASDRAGNSAHLKKKLLYEKPPKVSLMEIGRNPGNYAGKLVLIEGYAWGWAAKGPEGARKLPLAPGNTARSRNWGSIEDGTAVALFPISPPSSGMVRVYAVIKVMGKQWMIEPVLTEKK